MRKIEDKKLPLVMTRSKSGGAHLFLFLSEPIPAGDVQDLLRSWCVPLQLAGMEIFPKQRRLLFKKGDTGNWLNMPYFGKDRWMVTPDDSRVTPEQFLEIVNPVDPKALKEVFTLNLDKNPVKDGPPCLQALTEMRVEGDFRAKALLAMGIYLKKSDPNWTNTLPLWNQDYISPPLDGAEVTALREQLKAKDYSYPCQDQPLCSHCKVAECRKRKYGVGQAGVIQEIRKLDAKGNSLFFVDLGTAKLALTKKQLLNQELFNQECIEFANFALPPVSKAEWTNILNARLEGIEQRTDHVEYTVTDDGQFHGLLVDFLNHRTSNDPAELLNGKPYHDIDLKRYYFRFKDLKLFLERHRFTKFNNTQIYAQIRTTFQGDKRTFTLDSAGYKKAKTWWVDEVVLTRKWQEQNIGGNESE